nr:threonine/serine exporter family protein [Oceanobacillus damuensis]
MEETVAIEKICMLAGKIMLVSGAETNRVEDTMNRIASSFGIENPQSYATPTGINFSVDVAATTNSLRIIRRSTDLHKIDKVNIVSRKIAGGEITITEAFRQLKEIDRENTAYPAWVQILAAGLASGGFTIMYGGTWGDFLPAFFAGAIGFTGLLSFERVVEIRFLAEFFGAFLVGASAYLFFRMGFGNLINMVIIGGVMPLVPGLHITNAVRDLMSGHLVSGLSKGVEAVLTAFAIGAGVAVIYSFV